LLGAGAFAAVIRIARAATRDISFVGVRVCVAIRRRGATRASRGFDREIRFVRVSRGVTGLAIDRPSAVDRRRDGRARASNLAPSIDARRRDRARDAARGRSRATPRRDAMPRRAATRAR